MAFSHLHDGDIEPLRVRGADWQSQGEVGERAPYIRRHDCEVASLRGGVAQRCTVSHESPRMFVTGRQHTLNALVVEKKQNCRSPPPFLPTSVGRPVEVNCESTHSSYRY